MAEIGLAGLDSNALVEFITAQRWYGSKTREIAHVRIVDEVALRTGESPLCSIAVAEVRFHPGTHEMYQLLLGARSLSPGRTPSSARARAGRSTTPSQTRRWRTCSST